jgi:hypothetical protein
MRIILSVLIILFCSLAAGQAQALKVKVTAQYEHLPTDEQDDLSDFAEKVEQYFNGYTWIEDEYQYDVECNAQVIIETVQKKTFEKIYKTQLIISSASGENFYDKAWEFPYEKSFPLSHTKGQFDPLTHVLDYYAMVVLAGEMDTNGLLLGTPLYDKAMDIGNQGLLSQYSRGWSQRVDELQKITHLNTRPLREVKPDFFEAVYSLNQGKNKEAYDQARKVLAGIEKVMSMQPNNRYLQVFFNSHYRELAQLFKGHNAELEKLITFDNKHRDAYRDVAE